MGRDVTSDTTPLLKNADQNIGNSTILYPQAGTVGVVIPTTNPPRLLNLTGGSAVGQTVSVVMTVSRILQGNDNPNPGFPGPITGIIEFGNGGRFTKIEFDLTVGPFAGSINEASSAVEPQDGVTIVTVPTGVLRVYARYDNLLLAPLIGTNPPISHAQLTRDVLPFPGLPIVGPGGPLTVTNSAPPPAPATLLIPPEPVLVKAMVAYFTKTRSKVYKTINCYISPEIAAPPSILIGTPSVSDIALFPGYAFWALAPFTRQVTVQRFGGVAISILIHDGIRPTDYITVGAGAPNPVIDIVGNQNLIGIQATSPVNMLKLVCEVGV